MAAGDIRISDPGALAIVAGILLIGLAVWAARNSRFPVAFPIAALACSAACVFYPRALAYHPGVLEVTAIDVGLPTRGGLDDVPRNDAKQVTKDYKSDQEVRWCPGCGDYVVLNAVQSFLPQLGLKGDIARIGYFAVHQAFRSNGIGREIEEYCESLAREKNCDRIEVHCHERRKDAHRFYYRQGYFESPKYLMKSLRP